MRIDTRFLNWGVFFIIAGAIPLAVNQGAIDASTVAGWWRLWPLIIIGWGVGLLLRRTSLDFLGGLLIAAVFGVMVGGIFGAGTSLHLGDIACGDGTKGGTAFPARNGSFASGGRVDLEFRCGQLDVATGTGTGWSVSGTSHDGAAPTVDASGDRLSVRARDRGVSFFPFGDTGESWQVTVPPSTSELSVTMNAGAGHLVLAGSSTTDLSSTVNAGDLKIDLSGTPLRSISMTVNAGAGTIDLPAADVNGSFTVNAGSIAFCVPQGVGLRLTTGDNITGGNNFADRGLTKSGNTWQSADWATAANRISLSTTANLGSMTLDPEEGCK
jgi:hypothetical protein